MTILNTDEHKNALDTSGENTEIQDGVAPGTEDDDSEDTDDSEDSDETDKDATDEDGDGGEDDAKAKKEKQESNRISKLKRQRARAKREAAEAREELAFYKGKAESGGDKSKVDDTPKKPEMDDFDTQDDYIDALTDWKVDQKVSKIEDKIAGNRKQDRETESRTKTATKWQQSVASFIKVNPDFGDIVDEASDEYGIEFSAGLTEAIMDSELGPAVLYHLAKTPKEAIRISKLGNLAAIREIGRIEATLPKTKKGKVITKAPKPGKPIGSGSGKVAKSLDDPDLTQSEFNALRDQQQADKLKNAG